MSCLILEGPATHCTLYTIHCTSGEVVLVRRWLLLTLSLHRLPHQFNLCEVLRCTKYHISSSSEGLTSLHQAKLIVRFPFLPACMLFCRCHKIFIIRHFTQQIFPKIPKIFVNVVLKVLKLFSWRFCHNEWSPFLIILLNLETRN